MTKLVMLPYLMAKFPYIKWDKVLDVSRRRQVLVSVPGGECNSTHPADAKDSGISDMATSARVFTNKGKSLTPGFQQVDISEYWGQMESIVDVVKLQQMKLLPMFLDKIVEATLSRADDLRWQEGYNKKRGLCVGNYNDLIQADNLLIIDVSASIPRGVSSTMLALADTLREQMKADLIITGGCSKFWKYGDELPSPQELRDMIPLGNECYQFKSILKRDIFGRTYDNIVSFGDFDCPGMLTNREVSDAVGTRVGKLYSFRVIDPKWSWGTDRWEEPVGYCKWVSEVCVNYDYECDTEWIKDLKSR
ncbi:MAG: hypothetical protein KBT28_01475 [Bacteroidales bacterium]|nr:hypothetical protein [Candidatus Colimorpha merdihippi]